MADEAKIVGVREGCRPRYDVIRERRHIVDSGSTSVYAEATR